MKKKKTVLKRRLQKVVTVFAANEKHTRNTILTAMDSFMMSIVEILFQSTNVSSGRGSYSRSDDLDQRDFSGFNEKTPVMTAASITASNNIL